jgi:hypothetical protein
LGLDADSAGPQKAMAGAEPGPFRFHDSETNINTESVDPTHTDDHRPALTHPS